MTQANAVPDPEALLARLRARSSDPDRRTDERPTVFEAAVGTMSLRGIFSLGRSLFGDLRRVVAANRAGDVPDPELVSRADRLARDMQTPAPAAPLRRATAAEVRAAEEALGLTIPTFLARLYTEVADGGFGPGPGLLPLARIVLVTRELRRGEQLPRDRAWPSTMVPLVESGPGWTCVDVANGTVIDWDPEELTERMSEPRFRRTFSDRAGSIEAWLAAWERRRAAADRKPSRAEREARMVARARTPEGMARQARRSRALIARLSPEDRAKLPEGWEELVGRSDEDEDRPRE